MADEEVMVLGRDKYESSKDYAGRLLASMFQEVYKHTGREMPTEMFDRAHDIVGVLMEAVYDEYEVKMKERY